MNVPVKVPLSNTVDRLSTVMDDELHQLVLEGQVAFKDAIQALKDAGLALDKRFYPWLQFVEDTATGKFDKLPVEKSSDKPDLLSKKAEAKVLGDAKPESETNPEGAD
jgi:hypothetical protein